MKLEEAACTTLPTLLLLWIRSFHYSGTSRWTLPVFIPLHTLLPAGRVQGCLTSGPRTNSIGKEIIPISQTMCAITYRFNPSANERCLAYFQQSGLDHSHRPLTKQSTVHSNPHTLTLHVRPSSHRWTWRSWQWRHPSSGKNPSRSELRVPFAFSKAASTVLVIGWVINGHTWIAWSWAPTVMFGGNM